MPDLALDPQEQERELAELDRLIGDALGRLRDDLEAAVGEGDVPELDPEHVDRWLQTARALSVQVSNELPAQLEPETVAEIRGIVVNLLDRLDHMDGKRPLDTIDRFFVGAEEVRHIIRDEHVGAGETGDARQLIAYLRDALPRVTQADQARLAGISIRHLQRLGKEGGTPPRRLMLAARLVKLLRYVWSPEGANAWFYRRRAELDGRAPIDVMGDPELEPLLLRLARQGRAQHAA